MTWRVLDPALLSARDVEILRCLHRVRAAAGAQLERLLFADLVTPNARGSARRRSMHRLVDLRLVSVLPRRIGGERAGSAGLVYCLDSAGQRLLDALDGVAEQRRRPWAIGQMFLLHTLAVSELYVRLVERARAGDLTLIEYQAEPASWHESPVGLLKPDAFAVTAQGEWESHLWLEVDRGTESLPTLRRKLSYYVATARAGDDGPSGVLPKVLVTVESDRRRTAVAGLITSLPTPAMEMVSVSLFSDTFVQLPTGAPSTRGPPN